MIYCTVLNQHNSTNQPDAPRCIPPYMELMAIFIFRCSTEATSVRPRGLPSATLDADTLDAASARSPSPTGSPCPAPLPTDSAGRITASSPDADYKKLITRVWDHGGCIFQCSFSFYSNNL